MKRFALALALTAAALGLGSCGSTAPLRTQAQQVVDKARLTIETFSQRREKPMQMFRDAMRDAYGVMIFPGALKAAFIVGGEGGAGVLLARDGSGGWSNPAFFEMMSGSVGFQIGGQVSEVVLVLRKEGTIRAVIENQVKLGADLEVTAITYGAGLEGSTTTNLDADIVAFANSAGLYGGISVEGAVLARRQDFNETYYESGATPRAIVLDHKFQNPGAAALKTTLGSLR